MYLLNHYTAGVILFGDRTQLTSHRLPKYIHANTSTVFLVDPAQSIKQLDDSEHAAKRIQEYFRVRRTRHSITDWVDVKWKGGVMGHPLQTDGCSCGVVVVKMAKAVMESFPLIPNVNFECSKKYMKRERRELALEILEASVFDEHTYCAMCAALRPPGSGSPITDWVQCDDCERWYHAQCLAMDSRDFKKAETGYWNCPLCNT
ncbi:uncharacterized protein LOC117547477 isoform X2 [Gymnodraco acuticeps]|uniref:Uncharacterized protein LOC117547477 isoform X2 n=1 Tax=Gymnodraco acuticeps TaxID=8218 RepID=A0A6P8UBC6_GYMAC|nr:uncharacterized protein LOC117547477 isoform X2 [Gymnodraco acuticeps]